MKIMVTREQEENAVNILLADPAPVAVIVVMVVELVVMVAAI